MQTGFLLGTHLHLLPLPHIHSQTFPGLDRTHRIWTNRLQLHLSVSLFILLLFILKAAHQYSSFCCCIVAWIWSWPLLRCGIYVSVWGCLECSVLLQIQIIYCKINHNLPRGWFDGRRIKEVIHTQERIEVTRENKLGSGVYGTVLSSAIKSVGQVT